MTTATAEDKQMVIREASTLAIQSPLTRQRAADLWDAIRAFRKQEEANKETACRPLKTAWDEAKVPFDAFIKECEGYEKKLNGLMGTWDREQDRLARIEQDRLQAITDKANAKIEAKAEAKGIEPVFKVAPVVQAPPKSIETQAGTTQSRQVKITYGLKGVEDNADIRANDAKIKEFAGLFPGLFALDWVAFRKAASSGMLESCTQVEKREAYVYSQR